MRANANAAPTKAISSANAAFTARRGSQSRRAVAYSSASANAQLATGASGGMSGVRPVSTQYVLSPITSPLCLGASSTQSTATPSARGSALSLISSFGTNVSEVNTGVSSPESSG